MNRLTKLIFQAPHRLFVQVAQEVAVQVDMGTHPHGHGHHHRSAQDGGKQAGCKIQLHAQG